MEVKIRLKIIVSVIDESTSARHATNQSFSVIMAENCNPVQRIEVDGYNHRKPRYFASVKISFWVLFVYRNEG